MNLIWRLIWMWITAHLGARADIMGEGRIVFRCWPTDLDANMHMTNSRYASFGDLGRVDFMVRAGAMGRIRKAGLFPVLGSATLRFRRAIKPFQKFTVTTRVLTWDERWIYLQHKYVTATDVAAIAVVKVAFLGKEGRAPTAQIVDLMGYTGTKPESPIAKEITDLDEMLKA